MVFQILTVFSSFLQIKVNYLGQDLILFSHFGSWLEIKFCVFLIYAFNGSNNFSFTSRCDIRTHPIATLELIKNSNEDYEVVNEDTIDLRNQVCVVFVKFLALHVPYKER